jgi:hypothetical protein
MICIRVVGGRFRRSLVAGLAAMAAVLVACGGSSEPLVPTATLPQGTTTTDPYAVPAVIDEAYVNRVLAGLDKAYGDITRIVVAERSVPPDVVQGLNAVYVGRLIQAHIDLFQVEVERGLGGYQQQPGDNRSIVTNVISVKPNCVFAMITRDSSSVVLSPDLRFATQWVALVPADITFEIHRFNPTGWAFLYEGFPRDFSQPEDPCLSLP